MTISQISLSVLGACVVVGAAGMLMSQSGQISPAAQISVPRQCVVNICQLAPATGGQLVQIPPGGHYVVRTVPNDMWLTISQMEVVKDDAAAAALIAVGELHNGALTPKCAFTTQIGRDVATASNPALLNSPGRCQALGWTFRPGSSLVLMNRSNQNTIAWINGVIAMGYESRY